MTLVAAARTNFLAQNSNRITVEHLADATDCVQDAITTLTKLARMGYCDKSANGIVKSLSQIAQELDCMRQRSRAEHNASAALASFLSATVFQCPAALTN